MAKNRFAQPLYGKIIYIFETDLNKEDLATIFDPKTYWIDVTGLDCEVGYIQEYKEGVGIVWVKPPDTEPTLESEKAHKEALMKAERDLREVAVIEYKDKLFDYDDKARERMRIAKEDLDNTGVASRLWTCADESITEVTVADFEAINSLAATRSEKLHFQYRKLKVKIENCTDISSVQAITFDTDCSDVDLGLVME
jgi:hypothetical protein